MLAYSLDFEFHTAMGESAAYKEYVAGMLAGVATVIVGHPFDTVKVPLYLYLSLIISLLVIRLCLSSGLESWWIGFRDSISDDLLVENDPLVILSIQEIG